MADGIVFTGDTGIAIDNSLVGTTVFRQRVVIGGDATSSGFVNPSTVWPSSGAMGLPVRIIGSSGIVLGSVAQSSNWNISTGAVVGLTTTATVGLTTTSVVGLTTTSIVGLSSSIQNYITNSTTVPVYLGQSTSNIVGIVGMSSAVTLSSGTLTLGTLTTGTVVGLTTTSVVGLTTTSIVANASGSQTIGTVIMSSGLGASTAIIGSLSSGTAQIGILGPSSANVIGSVAASSVWTVTISSANSVALTSGSLYLGVVVSATSGVVGVSTSSVQNIGTNTSTGATVLLSTASNVGLSSGAAYVGTVVSASSGLVYFSTTTSVGIRGVVANATMPATLTSGALQDILVDQFGRIVTVDNAAPNMILTATVLTAGTCGSTWITAPGVGLRIALVSVAAYTTTLLTSVVNLQTSSGQAGPGAWSFTVPDSCHFPTFTWNFDPPLYQQTANNGFFVVSTSSASNVRVHGQYFVLSTA